MFDCSINYLLETRNYDRFSSLTLMAPELFSGKYKTVLNIGARESRFDFGNLFQHFGFSVTVLEAYKPNADYLKSLNQFEVINSSIEDYDFEKRKFDVVFWWHGPEHIEKNALPSVLKKIESIASEVVILGCPWGIYEQDALGGNPFEVHKSYLLPEDFTPLGYQYLTIGNINQHGSNITAVKYIRPFMSIVTRHLTSRPNMFQKCCDSIDRQIDQDLEHIIIEDEIGIGVPFSNALFCIHKERVSGDYVFILDDDNVIIDDEFISDIKNIANLNCPDLIFVKKYINEFIFPREASWNTGIVNIAEVDTSCVVVKRQLWMKYIRHFFNGGYCGDFSFISKIFTMTKDIYWQDKIYTRVLRIGNGKSEAEIESNEKQTVFAF